MKVSEDGLCMNKDLDTKSRKLQLEHFYKD